MHKQDTRSPLSRATGLGSARKGVGQWWAERVTAIALVPLTIWFLASVVALTGSDHAGVVTWLRTPFATICMMLLLVALFYHMALGLQVVVEDYVHSGARFPVLIAIRLGCFALAVTGIVVTLRISLGG
ncbi:succinate dehydrogenase, hydrophobic membrane anchor protein [Mesorhizobium sp. M7D.F.Ca.US.005.01.1.1]|uniref:succinate dehydrogenase, hydrophobic membrane anchor protein n=1 Tax=Mesorhizobium sp. M7D.F.Ca.US.005.01.1.1 TaxID=2493678 RepID=UPI000F75AE0B|nr:succinate dehydrogenase, hydrophobic membrane anchor protein [Mesorhizobium sp. M7D.F.Ca.US.005.01.1.1]AZO41570.1 succinate dehydrogenase, hydrophobic membrane anchor protein [Mesorhizobium sp. M7D.F.Ca.US.005.01.1.1]